MIALPPVLWTSIWKGAEVLVYSAGIDSMLSLEAASEVLSVREKARAKRYHFSEDEARWTRSRALLRCCIAKRLDLHPRELEFGEGEFGKPFLAGDRAGQAGLHFNTSHSGDYVAVCLSQETCGVDIECWRSDYPEEVAAYAFREEERAGLACSPCPVQHFLSLWTAKEAVMKCTGKGLSIAPSAVKIDDALIYNVNGFAWTDGTGERFALLRHCVPGSWMLTAALRSTDEWPEAPRLAQGRAV